MGETKQPPEADDAAADIEREIRRGRKFSLNDALGRLGGEGMLKGASPVPPIEQTEAALATGMKRWQVMRYIVLPQGLKAMTPLLLNQIIIVFQDTSLVYVVALRDFMTTASVVASRDGRPTEMYTLVAVVYLAICFSLSKAVEHYAKARAT